MWKTLEGISMNIRKINIGNIMLAQKKNSKVQDQPDNKFDLKLSAPLAYDIVSFQGKKGRKALQAAKAATKAAKEKAEALLEDSGEITNKTLSDEARQSWKLNMDLATRIHKAALKRQEYVHDFVNKLYGDLVATDKNPNGVILHLQDRAKEPYSIAQKAASRQWKAEDEIVESMTDLNAYKAVLNRKATQADMDMILDRLIPMITSEQASIYEIEVKLPSAIKGLPAREQAKYYATSKAKIQNLIEVQESVWNSPNTSPENIRKVKFGKPQYTPANYCALHILIGLNNKPIQLFEGQYQFALTGERKELDDVLFKLLDGKEVNKKYNPIANLIKALKEDTTGALERFKQYRKDANFALVQQEIKEGATKTIIRKEGQLYLSSRNYSLPPEYDLNNLWELKQACDKKAAIAANNLRKARMAKQSKNDEQEQKEKAAILSLPAGTLTKLIKKFGPTKVKIGKNRE